MKITIDTKEDSHEEIRRVIKMLSSLVGEREVFTNSRNIFDDPSPSVPMSGSEPSTFEPSAPQETGNIFGNMFGDNAIVSSEQKPNKVLDEEPQIEEKEDLPEIIEYE